MARDLYVQELARRRQNEAALEQMRQSVFRAPSSTDHFYLSSDWVPKLTVGERDAIEKGLRKAMNERFDNAIATLGDYYEQLGDFRKEANLFIAAAKETIDSNQKSQHLTRAGRACAKTGSYDQATTLLREAIRLSPDYAAAYEYLSIDIDVPRRQFDSARVVLNQGIQAGADPTKLYIKLAEVDRAANDKVGEEEALKQAADLQPLNFEVSQELGNVYLSDGRTDDAVVWLKKATEADPSSAEALFQLAQAEESAYQFAAAQNDYTKALALEPDDVGMQSRFRQFKDRVAEGGRPN
jgi:tetratricopeptide (TPR) repeat protein